MSLVTAADCSSLRDMGVAWAGDELTTGEAPIRVSDVDRGSEVIVTEVVILCAFCYLEGFAFVGCGLLPLNFF